MPTGFADMPKGKGVCHINTSHPLTCLVTHLVLASPWELGIIIPT